MYNKYLVLTLENMAKSDPKKAEIMFNKAMDQFKTFSIEQQAKSKAQVDVIYKVAEDNKCENVLRYLDNFMKEFKSGV